MSMRLIGLMAATAVFVAVSLSALDFDSCAVRQAQAQNPYYVVAAPPIPYNYFVPPPECPGTGAALYVSPRPTPPMVGHTFITYQPLAPHQFMYWHTRLYKRDNPGAGWTKTRVVWY